ncbi:hypothetical protein PLANTIT3_50177 [Plantibacter sp. T3]|nr:hypothetical protein PLANTIT3_50177 [Plantibacter sp. T3]
MGPGRNRGEAGREPRQGERVLSRISVITRPDGAWPVAFFGQQHPCTLNKPTLVSNYAHGSATESTCASSSWVEASSG